MSELLHIPVDEALAEYFQTSAWLHKAAPAKKKKRRRERPAWAQRLYEDRDADVTFDRPIPCPSCGILVAGVDGGRGQIDDGGYLDVIRCSVCRAMVVLDLRAGTLRAPTETERKKWRLTFWFVVMRDSEGD